MSNWKNSFTFILVPHNSSSSKSFSIKGVSLLLLGVIGGTMASLLLLLAIVGVLSNPYRVYQKYNSYEQKIASLEAQNDKYEQWKQISQSLQEEVKETRSQHRALIELTGLGEALEIDFSQLEEDNQVFTELEEARQLLTENSQKNQKLDKMQKFLASRTEVLTKTPMLWPVEGWISSGYGVRQDPMGGQGRSNHKGVDIASWHGTPVRSTATGKIEFTGRNGGYGKSVEVKHDYGFSTLYGHLSKIKVDKGDKIKQGDVIGLIGSTGRATGSHLHYEVQVNGETIDPAPYLVEKFDLYNKFAPREASLHARN
ncbi:MAG: M23 family metallopeptidase [bacterium]